MARVALIKDRTACRNRIGMARNKIVLVQLRARLRQIDTQVVQIDKNCAVTSRPIPGLARRFEILTWTPGVGPVAAIAMIIEMPELGAMSPKEAASLAGLAPITRPSGNWKGKARIGGAALLSVACCSCQL